MKFLSTLSLRRATRLSSASILASTNFYPRSPCGERQQGFSGLRLHPIQFLSTLSLRRATIFHAVKFFNIRISIHALLAESDVIRTFIVFPPAIFLSTLSLRRATLVPVVCFASTTNFYPRSPCGERHARFALTSTSTAISIHALLAESDSKISNQEGHTMTFLSTLSLRRATCRAFDAVIA